MLLLPKHVDCTIYGLNVNTTIQINNNKRCISCALNSALVQLNKAEMEGKSILLGAGVGKQLKSRKKQVLHSSTYPSAQLRFSVQRSSLQFLVQKKTKSFLRCDFADEHVNRKSCRLLILQQCCDLNTLFRLKGNDEIGRAHV